MPPPMIVRSYWEAMRLALRFKVQVEPKSRLNFQLNASSCREFLSMKPFTCSGLGCAEDGVKGFAEPIQPAAIVGSEHHIALAHLVDEKRQRPGIRAGAVDEKVFEENFRIASLAVGPFVLPEKTVEQERQAAAGAADDNSSNSDSDRTSRWRSCASSTRRLRRPTSTA